MRYYLNTQYADESYQPLRLGTLRGAYYLLAGGLMASTVFFLIEIFTYRIRNKRLQKRQHNDRQPNKRKPAEQRIRKKHACAEESGEWQQRERRRLQRKRQKQFQQMQNSIAPKFRKSVLIEPSNVYLP